MESSSDGQSFGLVRLDLAEQGQLQLPLAGIGSRGLAAIIDFVLIIVVALLFTMVGVAVSAAGIAISNDLIGPAIAAVAGALPLGGPLLFELIWDGQTPGKRLLDMRVISADGSPASAGQLVLRNIVRAVDFLPFGYLAGIVSIFVSDRAQRLGDMAGGTLVIREDPGAFAEVSGVETRLEVPPELHGIPETILRGAALLLDPQRVFSPHIFQERAAQIATRVRQHRPDLAGESNQQIWQRLRSALGAASETQ